MSSNFSKCWYFTKVKWPYFCTEWDYSHMFRLVSSPTCIVHADVTLTQSKVKAMELLKFQKLLKTALGFISALPAARSMWLSLQVGRNKPCTPAAMTVSPPRGAFWFAWQYLCTTSLQVLWSTSWSGALHLILHTFFAQPVSCFRNTSPYDRSLFCCSTRIISSVYWMC